MHLIVSGTSLRVFEHGVCAGGLVREIPTHKIPPGHYEAAGGALDDEGEWLGLRALEPHDVSDLARNGRRLGIRCRWIGEAISLTGIALLPADTRRRRLNLGDFLMNAGECPSRIFVSVLPT